MMIMQAYMNCYESNAVNVKETDQQTDGMRQEADSRDVVMQNEMSDGREMVTEEEKRMLRRG